MTTPQIPDYLYKIYFVLTQNQEVTTRTSDPTVATNTGIIWKTGLRLGFRINNVFL